jgi:hypothetical protein
MTYVGRVGKLFLRRTSCFYLKIIQQNIQAAYAVTSKFDDTRYDEFLNAETRCVCTKCNFSFLYLIMRIRII